jgi:hypothetical protein
MKEHLTTELAPHCQAQGLINIMRMNVWLGTIGLAALLGVPDSPASATIVVDTTITGLGQQVSTPCVIGDPSCQNPSGWTYDSEAGHPAGQGGTYNLTSPIYTAVNAWTTYSGNLIPTGFSLGIDANWANGQGHEYLEYFKTLICTGVTIASCSVDLANSYIPATHYDISVNNGNGKSDIGLTGFNLATDVNYRFQASVSNDTAGMEQFFLLNPYNQTVPCISGCGAPGAQSSLPEPASMLVLGTSAMGLLWARRRRS